MRSLEGQTALVSGGGSALGRAIALALSARGVCVVVTGSDEKALGRTVGEVVHGGGKARHLVGDVRDAAHLALAVERARQVFGGLDIVVAADLADASSMFQAPAVTGPGGPGRLLVAVVESAEAPAALVSGLARDLAGAGRTCNAIVAAEGPGLDEAADDVAALAVFLCSRAGARITGQTIAIRGA